MIQNGTAYDVYEKKIVDEINVLKIFTLDASL